MKTVGIVCEYNPFHNGHKYHIEKAKEITGADCVVCVMSGNIAQRGEVCIFDKWKRASDAVKNGADLVIELPEYYVLQGADVFSFGAIKLLDSLGIVDYICFGSECDDILALKDIARISESDEYNKSVAEYMREGKSYPLSCSLSMKKYTSSDLGPNDTLGIGYIRSLNKLESKIKPYCIKRHIADHNSDVIGDGFAGASYIRELIKKGDLEQANLYVPYDISSSDKIYNEEYMANIVKYVLSNLSDEEFADVKGMEKGLDNRIKKSLENSSTLAQIYEKASSSRYTISRIRRVIKCAMLNIDTDAELKYIRLLSFNDTGRKMIKEIKSKSQLEIISKVADYRNEDDIMLEWDINATDLMSYCIPCQSDVKDDYKESPVYIKG